MEDETNPLEQWNVLQAYIVCLQNTVTIWRQFFQTFKPERFPSSCIATLLTQMDTTLIALRNSYTYDILRALSVTPQASGFPFRYDVRFMETMYSNLRSHTQKTAVSVESLKKACLDSIFSQKKLNITFLERVSKGMLQDLLKKHEPLRLFKMVSVSEIAAVNGSKAYLCVWERFNYQNIPTLYSMIFEYHGKDMITQEDLSELAVVLREETSQMPLLERLGRHIDQALALVHPKRIGRLIFGPVFVSHLTQDDNPLQQALNTVYTTGEHVAASRIIYEYVVSEKTGPTKLLLDSQGRKHYVLQEFAVRQSDDECRERGVTHVEKYLFAPHAVVQLFSPEYRKEIRHQIIGG